MTIVIGYVPSPVGEAALKAAADEALEHNEPLVVVNTTRGLALTDRHLADSETLEQSVNALRAAGLAVTVRQGTSDQDASHDMLDAVEETHARLLVIGIRRRSAVGKLLLGSTALDVIANSPCHVLSVKPSDNVLCAGHT